MCAENAEPAPCDEGECPYQEPPHHCGPGGSALWPANLHAWQIHQSLQVLGDTTWRFYPVPADPQQAELLRLKLMLLATQGTAAPREGMHG